MGRDVTVQLIVNYTNTLAAYFLKTLGMFCDAVDLESFLLWGENRIVNELGMKILNKAFSSLGSMLQID